VTDSLRSISHSISHRIRATTPRQMASGPVAAPAAASMAAPAAAPAIRPAAAGLGAAGEAAVPAAPWSATFRTVLLLAFLGFALEQIIRAVLPLMILARGGDALLVGLLVGAFALPSIVLRPLVGRLADTKDKRTLLGAGGLAATILPMALVLPGVGIVLAVRFLQGVAWSIYSVANQSLMARSAPAARRGEASGLYMMMPALAALVAPIVGVALLHATGEMGPLLLASLAGFLALATVTRLPSPPARPARPAAPPAGAGRLSSFLEPSALPGTVLTVTFGSATTLFSVFGPVYALSQGAEVQALVAYFALFGLAQVVALPLGGRLSDRIGRGRSIRVGTGVAIGALGLAVAGGMAAFSLAAIAYALASALVNPAISAVAIERAPRGRIGSAMATYSIGYQIANGFSGVLWGLVIGTWGYPWPFVIAIGLQALTLIRTRSLGGQASPA
jgi:MFS family permease